MALDYLNYHVTCLDTKSKKRVSVLTKTDIYAAIEKAFCCSSQFILQMPFEDDWLDVDNVNDLPDSGKLQFVMTKSAAAAENTQTVSVNVPATSSDNVPAGSESPSAALRGMGVYSLPTFPKDVMCALASGSSLAQDKRQRTKIIIVLFDDLRSRVGWYPSLDDVRTACSSLVTAYPCLQDKVKFGTVSLRYATWFQALRQRFKDQRRSLTAEPTIQAMKQKYGQASQNARRRQDPWTDESTPKAKRARVPSDLGDGEDETSIAAHVDTIQQQWKSRSRDIGVITDRMQRTFSARRLDVENITVLSELLLKYPALQDESQLEMEFQRMTGQCGSDIIKGYWSALRTDRALNVMAADKDARLLMEDVSTTNVLERKQAAVLFLLPRLFNEKLRCYSVLLSAASSDDEIAARLSVYPTVVVTSTDNFLDGSAVLYFERKRICACSSLFGAMCTLFELFYVFNVSFPNELANTFNFLDVHVTRCDKKTKVRPAVQKRINILHAD